MPPGAGRRPAPEAWQLVAVSPILSWSADIAQMSHYLVLNDPLVKILLKPVIMSIGVRNSFRLTATQTVAASTALVVLGANTTGNSFSIPLLALQRVHLRVNFIFTIGATGGFKFQFVVPATPGNFAASLAVYDTVTPGLVAPTSQVATAAYANALAVAGTHVLNAECDYTNGATAGSISFQFACNSAANSIAVIQGAWMDATYL